MQVCPKCGHEIQPGEDECSKCGTDLAYLAEKLAKETAEETEKQLKEEKRDGNISEIHSTINQISKNVKEIMAFHKIKESVKAKVKKNIKLFRSEKEILDALELLFDKVWYDRHQMLKNMIRKGKTTVKKEKRRKENHH